MGNLISKLTLCMATMMLVNGMAQKAGDKVPKLKNAFVLSNGGPIHWHETVTRGTEIMNELATGANPDNHSFKVFITASVSDVTSANLDGTEVLIMNNTSGVDQLFNSAHKTLVENYVNNGGGVAGWHATTDTGNRNNWPWFIDWISTNYVGSSGYGRPAPMFKDGAIKPEHQYIVGHWQNRVDMIGEEWYQFQNPHPEDNPNTEVLMRVDAGTVGSSQSSLPMIWVNEEKEGRLWSSALGHFEALMARDDIVEMIYYGVVYAAGGYDIAGCMTQGNANYDPNATIPCAVDCCTPVSVKMVPGNGVDLFPGLKVNVTAAGKHQVSVYNAKGNEIALESGNSPAEYSFEQITQAGLYFVKTKTTEGVFVKRVEKF